MSNTMSNDLSTVTHCPKLNHIKPCWCRGRARCYGKTRTRKRCRRWVIDASLNCWQHREV